MKGQMKGQNKERTLSSSNMEALSIHKVKKVNFTYLEDQQQILHEESFQIANIQNQKQANYQQPQIYINPIQQRFVSSNPNKFLSLSSQHIGQNHKENEKNSFVVNNQSSQQFKQSQKIFIKQEPNRQKQIIQKSQQKKQSTPKKINYQQLYTNLKLSQSNQFSELGSPKQLEQSRSKSNIKNQVELQPQKRQSTKSELQKEIKFIEQKQNQENLKRVTQTLKKELEQSLRKNQHQIQQTFINNQHKIQQKTQQPENRNSNQQLHRERQNKFDIQAFKKLHPILKQLQTQLKNLKFPGKPNFSVQNIPHNQKIRSSSFIVSSKDKSGVNKLFYKRQKPIKVYSSSKNITSDQKRPYNILRTIKAYLQLIATGDLDSLQNIQIQQINKQKLVKVGIFYERVCIIVVAYGYLKIVDQRGFLKLNDIQELSTANQLNKFMINMISFALNNNAILQKIIEKYLMPGGQQIMKQGSSGQLQKNVKLDFGDQDKVKISKTDRIIMKRNFDALRSNNQFISDAFSKITLQDQVFSQNFKNICKCISKFSIQQTFYNLLDYFSFYLSISNNSHQIPFLAVAPNPYLPPLQKNDRKYTLVIDFIQVFCHGTKKSKNHIFRPYTQHFLSQMSRYYNIVSFTSALPNQIDGIIDILDNKNLIKHRLYKHHMIEQENGKLIKDLSRMGRNLQKIILLDVKQNQMNQSNTFPIQLWKGTKNDSVLAQLCPILASIAIQNISCERALKLIKQQRQKNIKNGIHYLNFGINLQSLSLVDEN